MNVVKCEKCKREAAISLTVQMHSDEGARCYCRDCTRLIMCDMRVGKRLRETDRDEYQAILDDAMPKTPLKLATGPDGDCINVKRKVRE